MKKFALPPKPDVRKFLSVGRRPKTKGSSPVDGRLGVTTERIQVPPTDTNDKTGKSTRRKETLTVAAKCGEGVENTRRHAEKKTSRPDCVLPEQRDPLQDGTDKRTRDDLVRNERISIVGSQQKREEEPCVGSAQNSVVAVAAATDRISLAKSKTAGTNVRVSETKDRPSNGRHNTTDHNIEVTDESADLLDLFQSIEIPDRETIDQTIDEISSSIFSSLTSYASEIEHYLLAGDVHSTSAKSNHVTCSKTERKPVRDEEEGLTGVKKAKHKRRFEFPSGYAFLETDLIEEALLDNERSKRVKKLLSEIEKLEASDDGDTSFESTVNDNSRLADTLRTELGGLIASDLIESIDRGFLDGKVETYDVPQWFESPVDSSLGGVTCRTRWVDRRRLSSSQGYRDLVGSVDSNFLHKNS